MFPNDFLGGGHRFKFGGDLFREQMGTAQPNHKPGNYVLTYDRVGTLSAQPVEIRDGHWIDDRCAQIP